MVSENGYCGHVNGGDVTDCEKTNVATERICREDCTSNSLCIAYDYGGFICSMIQPSDICPDGYELYNNTLARSASDIVKIEDNSFVCYIKESGNYFKILKNITHKFASESCAFAKNRCIFRWLHFDQRQWNMWPC